MPALEGVTDVAAPPAPARPPKPAHPEGNVKETVESILVAFILAFVFRAFIVEAFVIPTGSMAPTLLGAHRQITCADCGYRYTVNYTPRQEGGDMYIPPTAELGGKVVCPNCGYVVPDTAPAAQDIHYGDRILVLKYRYLFAEPQRWDVVVFKSPDNPPAGATLYTTNYIKRMIGRPGESVMILDGDIYVSTAAAPADPTDRDARAAFLRTFVIQQKPGYVQDALWRNVYDNDYLPHLPADQRTGNAWKQPWQLADGAGWQLGQDLAVPHAGRTREFRFEGVDGAGEIRFDPAANPDTQALTDFLAYDQLPPERNSANRNKVGDLKLACVYTRRQGDGPLTLRLSKRRDQFAAELSPGKATLTWTDGRGGPVKAFGPVDVPDLRGNDATRVELVNVDYRVSLKVNGQEVLTTGDSYVPRNDAVVLLDEAERARAERREPDEASKVSIAAAKQACTLEHLTLSRDVFYLNDRNPEIRAGNPSKLGSPDKIVTLGPEEYFVLGDNSLISGDARTWTNRVNLPGEDLYVEAGRVPKRFLLGKAFFVYWPAGHRPYGLGWGIIPNFGEMRFIH